MPSWLILFTIIVICLAVLMYAKRSKSVESFGDFKDLQMKFADRQSTYFHDAAGKAIYTNPGLNLSGLNDAVKQPDLYLPISPDRDYTSYFTEDPENQLSMQDEAFCKKAIHPRDLPTRQPKSKMACGWYYVNDVATSSVGALGTVNGPLFPSKLPANGEWIWDIPTAIMKEEMKACKRVKSCDLMNVNGIHGRCGFCERLGYAVPINFDGSEKYPDAQEACGQSTIRDANQCFKPSQPLTTPSGTFCGTYGRPSPDNSLRYYTQEECTKLGGDFSKNGECLKKSGGSFSYDCRTLNNPVTEKAAGPVSVCAPAPNGRISRDCQQSLAIGLGYAKTGGLMRILASGGSPNEKERMAIDQLKTAGYAVPDAILGSGDIDSQSAANLYQKIFEAMARGTSNLTRQAAQLLVTGNDSFDVCALDSNQTGPFPTACLQRAFRMAGCQASGLANPTEATASSYSTKTWGEITSSFTNLYNAMKSGKSAEQDEAVKKCLGITYARPDPVKCDYKQTLNGYDETSGRGQICFHSTLKQAKDTCAANPECHSFSFTNQPNLNDNSVGHGCFKMDKVGFTSTAAYTGFTKLDKPVTSKPPVLYKQTLGGYDQMSGPGQICFGWTPLKQAKKTCMENPQCKSFSFLNSPNLNDNSLGHGCYKMNTVGFQPSHEHTGFTKPSFDYFTHPHQNTLTHTEMRDICKNKGMDLCTSKDLCKNGQPLAELDIFGPADNWIAIGDKENEWFTYSRWDNRLCKTHTQVAGVVPWWGVTKNPRPWARAVKCCPKK